MDPNQAKALFEYNRWANDRAFEAVSRLTPHQYTRDIKGSFRSVRDTFVHVVSTEWAYLQRVGGTFPKSPWSPSEFPTVTVLKERWSGLAQEQTSYVSLLTADQLKKPITYINFAGEPYTYVLWQILQHVVNHSTYHRGQITTQLRQLGAKPESTDFLMYYDELG